MCDTVRSKTPVTLRVPPSLRKRVKERRIFTLFYKEGAVRRRRVFAQHSKSIIMTGEG